MHIPERTCFAHGTHDGVQMDQAAEEKTLAWISKFTAKFDEDLELLHKGGRWQHVAGVE